MLRDKSFFKIPGFFSEFSFAILFWNPVVIFSRRVGPPALVLTCWLVTFAIMKPKLITFDRRTWAPDSLGQCLIACTDDKYQPICMLWCKYIVVFVSYILTDYCDLTALQALRNLLNLNFIQISYSCQVYQLSKNLCLPGNDCPCSTDNGTALK